jgi:segregation and condensation protein A
MVAAAFSIDLSVYAGPMDLLLYLVRREELDVTQVSISRITNQYIDFLEVVQFIDVDSTADFLEPVGVLLEMKAKQVIPAPAIEMEEAETSVDDPADALVHRLVQYKRYRDVATILDEQSRTWQLRYGRHANDQSPRRIQPVEHSIAKIEIWDLVSAFGRILRERQPAPSSQVMYDEKPIHEYMQSIHLEIKKNQCIELQSLFQPGMHKSTLVAMFLATLELTRHHGVHAEQDGCDGPVWLTASEAFQNELDVAEVENMSSNKMEQSNMPVRLR